MKVALYCRVSTDEQREKESIETQVEKLRRYCEREQLEVHDFYMDDGISGDIALERRPDGARLLRDANHRNFDKVLATRFDRIGRGDPLQTLQDIGQLEKLGTPIECIEQWVDTQDPNGVLMRLVHIGVARSEWLTTSKRSQDGTERLISTGQWLGGICPYGYRVEGYKRTARIVPSDEPIEGLGMSEADVVRLIFNSLVHGRKSCVWLAGHLTALGVPPAYVRDAREIVRNKRKVATSGIWRPARIRNIVINTTYKGEHGYGKRSKKEREVVVREVPALVSADVWEQAQVVLRSNMLCPIDKTKRQYLLRGLIQCGCCGLNYIGMSYPVVEGKVKSYYRCSGCQNYRGYYATIGERCPSKAIPGRLEDEVWHDVEGFLRNPGVVLKQLADQRNEHVGQVKDTKLEIARLSFAADSKQGEKDAILGLFRRSRITEGDLDRQLDLIAVEEEQLRGEIRRLQGEAQMASSTAAQLRSAEDLLRELNRRLDEPLTWELKRQLVETLVEKITVKTLEDSKARKRAEITVQYRFENPIHPNCTGRDSWRPRA